MKRMLDLLYAGETMRALNHLPNGPYFKYILRYGFAHRLLRNDLTTMLLLIAVAEGEQL